MHGLSKSRILSYLQCPRRLWLHVHRPELAVLDSGAEARFAAGRQVGELARSLAPGGVLIDAVDVAQALKETRGLLKGKPQTLFEAAFEADGVLIRADLLQPEAGGRWRMIEVKSAASVKPYHYPDAAVQGWVARKAGVPLSGIAISHIDTSFVYPGGGDYRGLLTDADVTDEIADLETEVPSWVDEARATLNGPDPETPPGEQCRDPFECPFLAYCVPPTGPNQFPPELLPRGKKVAAQLRDEGYVDLREVPDGRLTHAIHRRVWQVTRSGSAWLDGDARRALTNLPRPHYYLDFETINFAVPIWPGTRPYMQIPFQWSCHIEDGQGGITHHAYLADGTGDPRRGFTESLVEVLGDRGTIFVYHAPFERARIQELAAAFPDLAPALNAAIERIVDLLPIVRDHYYHPQMRGSWSIKAVLPTIAPELAFDELAISHGGMAQEAFAELLREEIPAERRAALREHLLEYCERDTWAMVRIARFLQGDN